MIDDLLWQAPWRLPRPTHEDRSVADSDDLDRKYHAGLYAIARSNLTERIAYCRGWLNQIETDLHEASQAPPRIEHLLWTKLEVCNNLSRSLAEDPAQVDAARNVLLAALEFAFRRNHNALIGEALSQLGSFEAELFLSNSNEAAFTRAEIYLQRAMIYVGPGPAAILAATLGDLAHLWNSKADTYRSAIKLLDWWFVLRPDALGILFDKYQSLAIWERANVVSQAAKKTYADAFDAVQTAAANAALQRKKRSLTILNIGLKMARDEDNSVLVDSIERHIGFERISRRNHEEFLKL